MLKKSVGSASTSLGWPLLSSHNRYMYVGSYVGSWWLVNLVLAYLWHFHLLGFVVWGNPNNCLLRCHSLIDTAVCCRIYTGQCVAPYVCVGPSTCVHMLDSLSVNGHSMRSCTDKYGLQLITGLAIILALSQEF